MKTLVSSIEVRPDGMLRVALSGAIDEVADLDGIVGDLQQDAVIDLGGINRINSIGVHRWIVAISKLSSRHRIWIESCSYPVVLQANVVSNFFAAAEVRSCLAPYYCSGCNKNTTTLVTIDEIRANNGGAPHKACADCGGAMEFDELDTFFNFLRAGRRA